MDAYPPDPPERVARPVMLQRWDALTFVHWRYPPEAVARLLPPGLEPDVFDGSAWVGLVPFDMRDIRPPGVPKIIPWIGTFPETNIRTYTRDRHGQTGVWFCSLEITRLAAVAVARLTYRIPYTWAKMEIRRNGPALLYRSRRRWPAPRGAASVVEVEVGEAIPAADVSPLEHFLTARWGLHTALRRGLAYAPVEHPRWPLHRAKLHALEEDLAVAARLPSPEGAPLVHFSPGVDVRIGAPRLTAGT